MKTKFAICVIIFMLALLAAGSCSQDPIFFIISKETKPTKPRIEGAPTNMVVFERNGKPLLYAASGRLHWYAKTPDGKESKWDIKEDPYYTPQPRGKKEKIIALAATKTRLYALCMENQGVRATLKYITNDGESWTTIPSVTGDYSLLQSINTDPEKELLFAGVRNSKGSNFGIMYLDEAEDKLKMLKAETSMFSGMAYHDGRYYLCTRGDGIYSIDEKDLPEEPHELEEISDLPEKNKKRMFMNIIKLKDNTIIAVERNGGGLYKVNEDSFEQLTYTYDPEKPEVIGTGKYATGALALWEDVGTNTKLLIAGIQHGLSNTATSSYTYGYVEFELNPDGSFNTASLRHDQDKLSSAPDAPQYSTSLGKHPINHLFQAPEEIDDNMTFFASTQTAGLWSYRKRHGNFEWNAEE